MNQTHEKETPNAETVRLLWVSRPAGQRLHMLCLHEGQVLPKVRPMRVLLWRLSREVEEVTATIPVTYSVHRLGDGYGVFRCLNNFLTGEVDRTFTGAAFAHERDAEHAAREMCGLVAEKVERRGGGSFPVKDASRCVVGNLYK